MTAPTQVFENLRFLANLEGCLGWGAGVKQPRNLSSRSWGSAWVSATPQISARKIGVPPDLHVVAGAFKGPANCYWNG